jgi:hypothetical protein
MFDADIGEPTRIMWGMCEISHLIPLINCSMHGSAQTVPTPGATPAEKIARFAGAFESRMRLSTFVAERFR